jgi:hypothetical protein
MTTQIELQSDTAAMLQTIAQQFNLSVDAYLRRIASTEYSREALELMAAQGYKAGELTEHQIQEMLGFETRFDVHAFLKERGVHQGLSEAELEENRKALQDLLSKRDK